tara:strand:+ start:1174 stop:3174 length:2001 start_codon:yes stop_codon:yes gene_type:complete
LDGSAALESGRRVFYVYIGEPIDEAGVPGALVNVRDNIGETLSSPIRIELFGSRPGTFDASQEEIAAEISRVLNFTASKQHQDARRNSGQLALYGGLFHPNYLPPGPGDQLHVCDVKRDGTTGASEGYTFTIKYISTKTDVMFDAAGATVVANSALDSCDINMRTQTALGGRALTGKPYAISVVGTDVQFQPTAYRTRSMGTTFDCGPVSLAGGGCKFDLTGVVNSRTVQRRTRFCVGLTRVSTTQCLAARTNQLDAVNLGPRDYRRNSGKQYWRGTYPGSAPAATLQTDLTQWETYMDYGICVNSDGLLRVVQVAAGLTDAQVPTRTSTTADPDQPKWVNVDYTRGGTTAAPFNVPYDMNTNAADFVKVIFECSGSQVKIVMEKVTGALETLIDFKAAADPIFANLKPIDQTAWNLQPIMMINNNLERNSGNAPTDYFIHMEEYQVPSLNSPFQSPSIMPSYYTYCMERNTAKALTEYKSLSRRWTNMPLAFLPYYGYNTGTQFFEVIRPVLIVAPSISYVPTEDANTRSLLGFRDMPAEIDRIPPWIADALATNVVSQVVSSTLAPTAVSAKSIFVRLDNFNQKTMNAGNGNPSRIISHLPRFDGQNETGRLFFEPSTLVYLDLDNPNPLRVNQLDVSLVYADESLCKALVGTTIIVLHIRKKQ